MMWTDHGHQDFYRNRQSGDERRPRSRNTLRTFAQKPHIEATGEDLYRLRLVYFKPSCSALHRASFIVPDPHKSFSVFSIVLPPLRPAMSCLTSISVQVLPSLASFMVSVLPP